MLKVGFGVPSETSLAVEIGKIQSDAGLPLHHCTMQTTMRTRSFPPYADTRSYAAASDSLLMGKVKYVSGYSLSSKVKCRHSSS